MPSSIKRVKPGTLRPGDVVGIVAPASNIKRELLEAGCDALRRLGYRPFYLDSILEQMEGASRVSLVFLDACRENPFRMKIAGGSREV